MERAGAMRYVRKLTNAPHHQFASIDLALQKQYAVSTQACFCQIFPFITAQALKPHLC